MTAISPASSNTTHLAIVNGTCTCGEYLLHLLEQYGVDQVFGIPGVHTIELYRNLHKTRIKHTTPRHEQGAGFMAEGYARVSGKPGVCFVISGPGVTNIVTAMGQARLDSIPMLVISTVNRTHTLGMGEGRLHELPNQHQLTAGVSVFTHTLMRAAELPKVLARAFAVFNTKKPGPVHIEIPLDVMNAPIGERCEAQIWPLPSVPAPTPEVITQACALLVQAKCPLIAVGGGAVNAAGALRELAEMLDAPVVNTVNGKGILPYSHPLSVGGTASSDVIREEFEQADVVLAIGTEFAETDYDYYFKGDIQIGGELIRIDIDPEQLMRNVRPNIAVCSDANVALRAILQSLVALGESSAVKTGERSGTSRAYSLRTALQKQIDSEYAHFFAAIREVLPDVIVVGDSTQPTYFAWFGYETEAPRRYFHSASGYGTLGYAISASIGASIGASAVASIGASSSEEGMETPVVSIIGDGSAQFTLGEIACAVEESLPIIFIIWNNSGYAEIKRFMEDVNMQPLAVDLTPPKFGQIGEAFGCGAACPTDLAEFKQALRDAAERHGPTVIEIIQDRFASGFPKL